MKIQEQITADLSATASAGLAAATWIVEVNEILQLGATAVAIVAGVAATWWHVEKALIARKRRLKDDEQSSS